MKKLQNNRQSGITLIALVITIIVLIILAGVAINLTLGQNGLLNRPKEAREKYEIASAKEYIELKIDECIIEKGGDASLQDIIDYLAEDSSVTYYVALEEVGLVAGEVDIGSPKEIYVVYNSYQFKVDESKKVEFISIVDVDLEGKVSIEAQVKEHLGKNSDGKYEASVLLKATGDAEISKLEIQNPDGTTLTLEPDGLTTVGKDMTIEFDKTYKVILTTANGHRYTKKIIEKSEETIMNAEQLASFRDKVNSGLTYEGKTVRLGADIDLSAVCGANVGGKEVSWEPIGNYGANNSLVFSGIFNGNNYQISNFYLKANENFQGLFGKNAGTIENLEIYGNIYGDSYYLGGIIGFNNGIVKYCFNSVRVNGYGMTGGIVGLANTNSEIERCTNNAYIYGEESGGIAGRCAGGTIRECINNGYIQNVTSGGIVGYFITGKIYNCYNTGKIQTSSVRAGGICGAAGWSGYATAYLYNCYNKGSIVGSSYVGEIIGLNNANGGTSQTINCYSSGITAEKLNNGQYSDNAFTNDIKEKVVDETTGEEKEVWKYNNGYPILKWQLQENQVAE